MSGSVWMFSDQIDDEDIYKKYVDSTNQSLEDFVTAFHDKNLDGSSSNAENQLLGYQQQQTELMKNFATVVSEAVSTSIANTMRTELVPIFDEMKSTDEPDCRNA